MSILTPLGPAGVAGLLFSGFLRTYFVSVKSLKVLGLTQFSFFRCGFLY
jgi:hypothetical protein